MIVIVCGSREWFDETPVLAALENLHTRYPNDLTVVEGGARGADRIAGFWASLSRAQGVAWVRVPAEWDRHEMSWCVRYDCDGFGTCIAAGPRRNQLMLEYLTQARDTGQPTATLAFKDDMNPGLLRGGTEDMVRRSIEAGVETHTYDHTRGWQLHPAYAPG